MLAVASFLRLLIFTAKCSCGDLRLTNYTSENEGNVEVCWNGEWLAVRYSSSVVPSLICQQLGFSAEGINLYS